MATSCVYSFFHNSKIRYGKKYFILEGIHELLPQWHKLHDEYYLFDYNLCGIVKVYLSKTQNESKIKVLSRIDGGYCDDNVDYYVSNYATLESETSDGETHPLPDILKLYLERYRHGKDTEQGTLLTEDAINHLNDEDNDTLNNEVDEDYGSCPMCSSSYSCTCASICHNGNDDDDDYDGCDDFTENYCELYYNK